MSTETEQAIKSLYMPKVFKGREKVIMPISKELFMKDPLIALRKYLNQTIGIFNGNVSDIETLHEYYLGNQAIFSKLRKDESLINNKVVENHIYKQVNFKVGFMYGNPLEYTITNEKKIDTDDMTYLNSYLNDVNKARKSTNPNETAIPGKDGFLPPLPSSFCSGWWWVSAPGTSRLCRRPSIRKAPPICRRCCISPTIC